MSELVIVVTDLYFGAGEAPDRSATGAARDASRLDLPGLERMTRFGRIEALSRGWRAWLAEWVGRPEAALASPGAIAAAALPGRDASAATASASAASAEAEADGCVWLADPVRLEADLTTLSLASSGILRLAPEAQRELCRAFDATFAASGYRLATARNGRFLGLGPALAEIPRTVDPARFLGSGLADALPAGSGAAALRRLGVEIEMWLHEHPLNLERARRRRAPIGSLWLWGGGAPYAASGTLPAQRPAVRSADGRSADARGDAAARIVLISDDPYVEGLAKLAGIAWAPLESEGALLDPARAPFERARAAAAGAARMLVQLELFHALDDATLGGSRPAGGAPAASLAAHEAFDRDWIVPALASLARREIERLVVIVNDRKLSLTRLDAWKRWRPQRPALVALG